MTELARLTTSELYIVKDSKPVLERAAKATSIPWQAIAAVWYREAGLGKPNINPFQFDPVPSNAVLRALIRSFVKWNSQRMYYLNSSINDFGAAAVYAGCWLRH